MRREIIKCRGLTGDRHDGQRVGGREPANRSFPRHLVPSGFRPSLPRYRSRAMVWNEFGVSAICGHPRRVSVSPFVFSTFLYRTADDDANRDAVDNSPRKIVPTSYRASSMSSSRRNEDVPSFGNATSIRARCRGVKKPPNEKKSVGNVGKIRASGEERRRSRRRLGEEFEKARSATVALFSISASSLPFPGRSTLASGIAPIPEIREHPLASPRPTLPPAFARLF